MILDDALDFFSCCCGGVCGASVGFVVPDSVRDPGIMELLSLVLDFFRGSGGSGTRDWLSGDLCFVAACSGLSSR